MDTLPEFEEDIDLKKKGVPIRNAVAHCPELKSFLNGQGRIDLGDSAALRAYNSCLFLLLRDLRITIPEGFLIPTAGLRIAVTDFIWKKIHALTPSPVLGIEVGIGATAINSLLLAQKGANMIGTEVDPASIFWAKKNIEQNGLQEKIHIIQSRGKILAGLDIPDNISFAFTLPPYYEAGAIHLVFKDRGFQGRYSELVAGESSLDFTRQFLEEAKELNIPVVFVLLDSLELARSTLSQINELGWRECWVRLKAGTRKRYLVCGEHPHSP